MLFGVLFEDLVSRRLTGDNNPIDDYLQRRGWRESVPGRQYLSWLASRARTGSRERSHKETGRLAAVATVPAQSGAWRAATRVLWLLK